MKFNTKSNVLDYGIIEGNAHIQRYTKNFDKIILIRIKSERKEKENRIA